MRKYFIVFEMTVTYDGKVMVNATKCNYELETDHPIESLEDVRKLENQIEDHYRQVQPVEDPSKLEIDIIILNWKRFE